MSFQDRRGAIRCTVAGLGAIAVLVAGACGATGPPVPPPLPPPAAPAPTPVPPGSVPVVLAAPAEHWDDIAWCETGGDWHADTGNGRQGGLQLSPSTWMAHGGGQFAPRADEASREQQIVVADRVRAEQGWQAWSSCANGLPPG